MSGMSAAKRVSAVLAFGLLVGLGGGAARATASARADHLTYLTFSRPVALPGVTLAAGTYAFEVPTADTAGYVVMVRDRARTKPLFTGFTYRTPRPANWSEKRQIVFGESAPGEPAPILAWYPVDNAMGFEFIYRR